MLHLHGCDMRFAPCVVARWRVHGSQTTSVRGAELRGKDDRIRSLVLSRLPADRREAYAVALCEYQGPSSLRGRARRKARDAALGLLPPYDADRIVGSYLRLRG